MAVYKNQFLIIPMRAMLLSHLNIRRGTAVQTLYMAAPCRKVVAHQPQRVTLRKAEIRWVRWSEQEMVHLTNEEIETVELFRKFLGILNKLAPQKFKDLAEQALQLPINSLERLKGCTDIVFNKVCEK